MQAGEFARLGGLPAFGVAIDRKAGGRRATMCDRAAPPRVGIVASVALRLAADVL